MTGSVLKNLRMFTSLCGHGAMPNVTLATTMWDKVDKKEGNDREDELKRDFWNGMVADGCMTARFHRTYQSAWQIIGGLAEKDRARVLVSRQIVKDRLRLNETEAGLALNKELEKLIKDRKNAARRLQEQADNQDNELVVQELNAEKAEIEERIRHTAGQLSELKIPFTRRVRLFFKGRRG
jgi:chromosome condensin MukBEF ATPase and DNA-binding subunit MukB